MSIKLEIIPPKENTPGTISYRGLTSNTRAGIRVGLYLSGKDVKQEFQRQVTSPTKTGRIYIVRGRPHQSSAAGETPANLSGLYFRSGDYAMAGDLELRFGNSAPYAGFLENGTFKMRSRPGLGNSVQASQRDILRNVGLKISESV